MPTENVVTINQYRLPSTTEEILGLFLKHPEILTDYKRSLAPRMFQSYEWLYKEMLNLEGQESLTFKAISILNQEQLPLLRQLRDSAIAPGRMPQLIEKLKTENLAQELKKLTDSTTYELTTEGRNPNEVLADLQKKTHSLSNTDSTELHDPDKDIDQFFEWMEEIIDDPSKAFGILTGLEDIDRMTTGFHRGDLIVIGARTSVGKSAVVIDLALRMNKLGSKVAIYSLEMSKKQIYLRMLSNLMNIDFEILKTGRMSKSRIPEMKKHKEWLRSIYIDDTRAVSPEYITDSMRRVKRERGMDVCIVDYIQDIKEQGESNDNGGSALARVCRKLRKAGQDYECAMVGLSQVNRDVETRKDKRPMPSDLTGSAGIESSADVIAMLYRDDYYYPDSDQQGIMEINFAKQRNGKTGRVDVYYERKYQQLRPKQGKRY